ncbi:pyridoxal phosphate-dependent transferase [Suillus subluteus]|nr:pyridoxal phosphate-dependent transferase [Suillus subluteus]
MLSKHINPDRLISKSKDKKSNHHHLTGKDSDSTSHLYGARYGIASIPKFHIPSKGTSAETTYQLIHDELSLDGSTSLNNPSNDYHLSSLAEEIHTQCVSILADLWHAPSAHEAIGTATTGSSEAIQLGGLTMKRHWQEHCKAEGKSIHEPGPNIVMGVNAQVTLKKFACYFKVECCLVPVSVKSKYRLNPKKAMEYVNENTIGMSDLLDEYQQKTGINIPIHVDGASGAFVVPFAHPKLLWDFKLPRVVSINTSGHKFGLAYVGVGWVVWHSKEYLPKDLIFELHYLGSVEYSFSLNFSRPAAPIITQYFNFIHLGFEGYRTVAKDDLKNARLLIKDILQKNAHNDFNEENMENYEEGLPVVAFRFSDSFQGSYPDIQQKWIQILLRAKGWIVPNYKLAPDLKQVQILQVVIKENMTESLVDHLLEDIVDVTQDLIKQESPTNALNLLGNHSRKNCDNGGKMDEGSASGCSSMYTKPC